MEVCEEGHEEIVFAGRRCPMCERTKDMAKIIDKLEGQVFDLENAEKECPTKDFY